MSEARHAIHADPITQRTHMSHPALDLARRALLLGAVAAAGILAMDACSDAPSATSPDLRGAKGGTGKPGSAETVLFTGTRNGNMDIYAMNPDGSNVRRLTTDTAADVAPDFAPDNRKFVFARSSAASLSELYTANADGSKQTKLTSSSPSTPTARASTG
jgi:dipeptidyl aminopeptidase/acylaminoacyl peptidase